MEKLISHLKEINILKTKRIIDAFSYIDRKDFVLPEYQDEAYLDHPLHIGYRQTISQPFTVAFMLELLQPKQGDRILDVGSGSGWTTALLAHITGPKGKVSGVEIIPKLVQFGKNNLKKYDLPNATIVEAGEKLGLPQSPFDKILVSAESQDVPQELINQLHIGGTMIIPIKHSIWKVVKASQRKTKIQKFEGFVFVPLV